MLGATLGLGAVAVALGAPVEAVIASQETPKLAIALLDDHWKLLQPLVEAYGERAGVEFDATPLSYEDLYIQLSLILTQRADTYDVVFLPDPWVPQFASFLTALDVPPDSLEAFVPVASAVSRFPEDARPVALPVIGEAQFFVARADWLEQEEQTAPETWDETVEAASTIAAQLDPDEERAAFGMRTLASRQLAESFIPILRGYGKALIDLDTSIPQLDTPEALEAMDTFLVLAGLSPAESAAVGDPSNAERFELGDICMMSNFWSSELLSTRSATVEGEPGAITSTLQPAQGSIPRKTMTGIWLAGIPVGSLFPDAARAFLDWLISDDLQRQLPALALPPVRTDVFSDADLVGMFPDLPTIGEMLSVAVPRPRSPFYPQLEQLLGNEIGKALSGDASGADAMKNANIAIREFLVREGVLDA